MRRFYADIPEGQMHYRAAGTGEENVILLHMSGSSYEEYEGVGDLLAECGYHVYAPDLLGFGSSDKPSHYYYAMDEHIASLLSFMDSVGIGRACVCGNMATANMAARMGVYHPERVRDLLLCHPLYNPDLDYFKRRGHTLAFCKVDVAADGSHLQELWKRSAKYGDAPAVSDRRCADLLKAGEWGETLHWALHDDSPFGTYLKKLTMKTVVAAYGFFSEPTLLEAAAAKIPNGVFVCLDNAAPYLPRTAPQRVAELVCSHFPINH